ncbi:hypothetical protein [Streptomyces flavochromogenes]|uniref:hypothetical protein n=1 Tax=Streptomyces flavochromogenes TaxID=68199 RepID=UPI00131CEBCA|nr:hypothetical protein [Streptomyces flavochromogenes]
MSFKVVLNVRSLKVDSVDPVFVSGDVHVVVGGCEFPSGDWTDSPISAIGSLGSAIQWVRKGEPADMYFFEGPYFVKLSPSESFRTDQKVRVTALRDYWDESAQDYFGEIVADSWVSLGEVERAYSQAVSSFVRWGEENGEVKLLALFKGMPK